MGLPPPPLTFMLRVKFNLYLLCDTLLPTLVLPNCRLLSQGIGGFYRGLEANVARAMVLNGTKMACYDQIKQIIDNTGLVPGGPKGLLSQFFAAFGNI